MTFQQEERGISSCYITLTLLGVLTPGSSSPPVCYKEAEFKHFF